MAEPSTDATAIYVYAIARVSPGELPDFGSGIGPVDVIEHDGLRAIVSHVPAEGFGTSDQLRDLEWITRHVQAHDDVIKAAMSVDPVIPLRFCTVFRDEHRVRDLLKRHRRELRRTLDTLDGKREWGVKVRTDPRSARSAANGDHLDDSTSGREYLLRKRRTLKPASAHHNGSAKQVANDVNATLSELSVDSATLPLRDRDGERSVLFNAAYLVADDRLAEFRSAITALADAHEHDGVAIDLTGPWPPYNFVRLNLSDDPTELEAAKL